MPRLTRYCCRTTSRQVLCELLFVYIIVVRKQHFAFCVTPRLLFIFFHGIIITEYPFFVKIFFSVLSTTTIQKNILYEPGRAPSGPPRLRRHRIKRHLSCVLPSPPCGRLKRAQAFMRMAAVQSSSPMRTTDDLAGAPQHERLIAASPNSKGTLLDTSGVCLSIYSWGHLIRKSRGAPASNCCRAPSTPTCW